MMLLLLPLGVLLPASIGWMAVRLIEGNDPVLRNAERIVIGFVLGLTGTMFITFLIHLSGVLPLSRIGFASVQILLLAITGGLVYWKKNSWKEKSPRPLPVKRSQLEKIFLSVLALAIAVKLVAAFAMLTLFPAYFDDVYNNWNLRGKVFFETQELHMQLERGAGPADTGGVSSYPPTVPMTKAWLANLAGEWNEPLINSVHILWFGSVLLLLFFVLRRLVPTLPALLGVYAFMSLPLVNVHASSSYADLFVAAHLLTALSLAFFGLHEKDSGKRKRFLMLSAVATGLLIFTKNEALLLYVPFLVLLQAFALFQKQTSSKDRMDLLVWSIGVISAVLVPWLLFKWSFDLPFGNAKDISGIDIAWQKDVLRTIAINTFLEANWLVLFPLFLGILIARWRYAFFSFMAPLSLFLVASFLLQIFIYCFTSLSVEALNQTGLTRGFLHLIPIVIVVGTFLLHGAISAESEKS